MYWAVRIFSNEYVYLARKQLEVWCAVKDCGYSVCQKLAKEMLYFLFCTYFLFYEIIAIKMVSYFQF